jgi:esterase/lipase superfamily enzyme
MGSDQLFELLLKCNSAQLTAITAKLQLNKAFLPGPQEAIATRAEAMLQLVEQRGALPALEKAIGEVLGPVRPVTPPPPPPAEKARCILILAANPADTDRLRLDQEVKRIKRKLEAGEAGRRYRVETEWAVTASELAGYLLKYTPSIVHFSGHGSPSGEIILEGDNGEAKPVRGRALVGLFETLQGTETVVLNACYSSEQANALAQAVPQVIGMARSIGDESAIRFAEGFYEGLAYGKDYATSFRLGCLAIDLAALPDAVVPHFTTGSEDRIAVKATPAGTADAIALHSTRRTRGFRAEAGQEEAPRLFPLWYGTNRRPNDPGDPSKGYSTERDATVHLGTCKVAVPKSHEIGSIGSPWWQRLLKWDDDRLKLVEIASLAEAAYWKAIGAALAEGEAGERRALVYIHGFNVSFEEAALRAAQIGADVKVPGVMAFFSWPSTARCSPVAYQADEATIEASEGHIADFLNAFATRTGAKRVDIIAHSMGNRGLLRAFQRMLQKASRASKLRFGNIVLAAPDVDVAVFKDLAASYSRLSDRTTLYVSSRDKALAASALLHGSYPRAGFTPPVLVVPGIDTIEVSNIDLTFLGHGYFAGARDVLHDIHNLIMHGEPPKSRLGLAAAKTPEGAQYWLIGA